MRTLLLVRQDLHPVDRCTDLIVGRTGMDRLQREAAACAVEQLNVVAPRSARGLNKRPAEIDAGRIRTRRDGCG
jgi:hypothetical protein